VDPAVATNRLGETWELHRNGQKPYSCGVVSHPTIDAMRTLRTRAGVPATEIEEVRAKVNPYVLELMGKTELNVGLEGKFSIYHCAAVGYIDGTARVRQFSDAAVKRPEIVALRQRVHAETDAALPTSAAVVDLMARDGRTWHEEVHDATGTPGNPMTDEDIVAKYLDLVEGRLTPERARELADRAMHATDVDDVRSLTALVSAAP
jgi:2-methylcitrate dehydratase PrpD